jgi:hypothetical protein
MSATLALFLKESREWARCEKRLTDMVVEVQNERRRAQSAVEELARITSAQLLKVKSEQELLQTLKTFFLSESFLRFLMFQVVSDLDCVREDVFGSKAVPEKEAYAAAFRAAATTKIGAEGWSVDHVKFSTEETRGPGCPETVWKVSFPALPHPIPMNCVPRIPEFDSCPPRLLKACGWKRFIHRTRKPDSIAYYWTTLEQHKRPAAKRTDPALPRPVPKRARKSAQ